MKKTWENQMLQVRGRVIESTVVLLLLSAGGLTLLAQHAREQADVLTGLLALHLASWSYVLGIVGLVLLAAWWLVEWLRAQVEQPIRSRYSLAESRRRRHEGPEIEGRQFIQHDVAPAVPSRLARQSEDRNEATRSTKVA
jgi:hypothetical protein